MTRLTSEDISDVTRKIQAHEQHLHEVCGRGLLGIGCHAWGVDEVTVKDRLSPMRALVVPVTAGGGEISGFAATVAAILGFIGLESAVSAFPDVAGLTEAFQQGTDIVFMADDDAFTAFHLPSAMCTPNDVATGRGYAAVIDLMVAGGEELPVLVMGCGRVGEAAARALLDFGFTTLLYDVDGRVSGTLMASITADGKWLGRKPVKIDNLKQGVRTAGCILEATPGANTLPAAWLRADSMVAAPGVPLGLDDEGQALVGRRLVHDKLEIGVAAMLAGLFRSRLQG